jgi:hypothetical protein
MSDKRNNTETDYDFRRHLRNTILLLGGRKEIANLLIKSIDFATEEADVDALRNYNIELITSVKDRLAGVGTITVRKGYDG